MQQERAMCRKANVIFPACCLKLTTCGILAARAAIVRCCTDGDTEAGRPACTAGTFIWSSACNRTSAAPLLCVTAELRGVLVTACPPSILLHPTSTPSLIAILVAVAIAILVAVAINNGAHRIFPVPGGPRINANRRFSAQNYRLLLRRIGFEGCAGCRVRHCS